MISAEEAGSRLTLSRNQGVHTALLETQLRGSQYSPPPHWVGWELHWDSPPPPAEFLTLCGVNTQVTGSFSSLVDLDPWATDTPYTPSPDPHSPSCLAWSTFSLPPPAQVVWIPIKWLAREMHLRDKANRCL